MCGWGWSLPAQHTGSLGSQHTQLGHVQLSPTSTPKSSTKGCSGWHCPQINFMATKYVETSESEKSITPAWVTLKVDVALQGVLHTRPTGLFPVDLCCGWGQSTDPSVLFRVVQYYSVVGWMTTLCFVIREYLWPSKEGWVPGDGITLGFLLPDREFLSVVTPMFFHTPTDTTTFLDKEEDDGTQMRERNGLRELGYVGVFLPFGVFSSWISMSDLLETSLGLKCFFSCSTHTRNCFGLFCLSLFIMQLR